MRMTQAGPTTLALCKNCNENVLVYGHETDCGHGYDSLKH